MKKIITYSIISAMVAFLFTSCVKEKVYDNSSYWLSQERGEVVYSNNACGFYVVETYYGYTIIENLDGLRTYAGDIMYGDFGAYGRRDLYNYTAGIITRGDVLEYDLSYHQAQDAIDYYCPLGKAAGLKIWQSASSESKMSRSTAPVKK